MTTTLTHRTYGGTATDLVHVSSRAARDLNKQAQLEAVTTRDSAASVSFEEGQDELLLRENGSVVFGGVLKDVVRRGNVVRLTAGSYEEFAKDAEPTPPKLPYDGVDDAVIVQAAIDAIPQLSAGTIDTVKTDITYTFSHATQALVLRTVRDLTRGEIRYRADKTVDYLSPDSLGSDKTGTTISPANQNITESADVNENAGENVANHLRMIGAGGASVDVVADSFDASTDRVQWGRAVAKEAADRSALTLLGEALLEDLPDPWLEVETTLVDLDPALGDTYHVEYAEKDIDDDLRVAAVDTIRDSDGTRHQVTLSNRSFARLRNQQELSRNVWQSARTGSGVSQAPSPHTNIPLTRIPAGTSIGTRVIVPDGHTLYLWSAGRQIKAATGDNATQTFVQLRKNLSDLNPDGDLVWSEPTAFGKGSPLATVEGVAPVEFRIQNDSSNECFATASFAYTIEEDPGAST